MASAEKGARSRAAAGADAETAHTHANSYSRQDAVVSVSESPNDDW